MSNELLEGNDRKVLVRSESALPSVIEPRYAPVRMKPGERFSLEPEYTSDIVEVHSMITGNGTESLERNEPINAVDGCSATLLVFKNRTLSEEKEIAKNTRKYNRVDKNDESSIFTDGGGWSTVALGFLINSITWVTLFTDTVAEEGLIKAMFLIILLNVMLQTLCFMAVSAIKMVRVDRSIYMVNDTNAKKLLEAKEKFPQFLEKDEMFYVSKTSFAHELVEHSDEVAEMVHRKLGSFPEISEFDAWCKQIRNILALQKSLGEGFPVKLIPMMSREAMKVSTDLAKQVQKLETARAEIRRAEEIEAAENARKEAEILQKVSQTTTNNLVEESIATSAGAESFISSLTELDLKEKE